MTPRNNTTDITELGHGTDARQERQQQLLDLLRQTAPEVVSDNQIDVERLKELLGRERLAPAEHYELSWAGKKDARREIQKKTANTLLPYANNPESAQHMLIEGENLEVLRVLQKSYYGKVKMIYIDPPYNTGNDSFVYPDDYSETLEEYQKRTGEKNEAGFLNKQSLWKKNSKESGQYHSAWLSMMYPRLYLARNLLREDGVIFISIDDNEAANLKLLCDEIFGDDNFVGQISVVGNPRGRDYGGIARMHDYVLAYKKSEKSSFNLIEDPEGQFKLFDDFGGFELRELRNRNVKFNKKNRGNLHYPFYIDLSSEDEHGLYNIYLNKKEEFLELYPKPSQGIEVVWRWGKEKSINNLNVNIKAKPMRDGGYMIVEKYRESRAMARSVWWDKETNTEKGTLVVKELLNGKFFDYPKPVEMISRLVEMGTDFSQNDIVLDFFAGSGTIAQAVMEMNLKDDGNRQSISVQLPEKLEQDSEAYQAGYLTIADITRARIEKAVAKLKAENPEKTEELACANFTLAPSNFKVWNSELKDTGAILQQLDALQNTEKAPDEQTAMLTELLLKNGLGALGVHSVSKPRKLACGVTVHRVLREDDRYLWLCFEPYVEDLRDEILSAKPAQVIMLNSCFTRNERDKGDGHLSNLQLSLSEQGISLLII